MDNDPSSSVRIAVLIDADNTSPKYAEALLEELAKYGTPTIKRAYGDFSSQRLSGWTRELNARAIRAIHQNAFTVGKNSTDSALIIDAMDLLYAGNVEAFALVSSDSDFTGLALRLRESGKIVYGLGRQRTPQSLQNACDRFIALEVLGEEPAAEPAEDGHGEAAGSSAGADRTDDAPQLNLESALTRAVNATADDEGWTSVSAIGNHLSRTHASFDPRNFGHAKLSSLVAAQSYLESVPEGRQILVRLAGRPAKGAKAGAPAADAATQATGKQSAGKAAGKQATGKQSPPKKAAKKATSQRAATTAGATEDVPAEAVPADAAPAEDAPTEPTATQQQGTARTPTTQATTKEGSTKQTASKRAARPRKAASSAPAASDATSDTSSDTPLEQPAEPASGRPTVTKTARKRPAKATAPAPGPEATSEPATAEPATPEPATPEPARPVVTRTTRAARKTSAAKSS